MPEGLPSAAQLMGEKVTFFSLDTDVIQSAGYKFDAGALHKLALQRPHWMRLQLTEIVEREVKAHRMIPVVETMQQLNGASDKLTRATGLNMSSVNEAFAALSIERSASDIFDKQIKQFVESLGGQVLPIEGTALVKEMFSRYFGVLPPFELKKDKKCEFPDAAALLVLEEYAKVNSTLGVLISRDAGWGSFANRSAFLYRVESLEDFTTLFASEGANAETIKKQVREALADRSSPLARDLELVLSNHIGNSSWAVDDLYSGGPERLEGEVCEARLELYEIDLPSVNVWFIEHDPSMCLVELTASVRAEVHVSVEVFVWDSIDREEISLGSMDVITTTDQDVDVFLTCSGKLLQQLPSEWEVEIEISEGEYSVSVGEIDIDFGPPD